MTSAKLLLYNCFIMLLCSLDNNGVADVFCNYMAFFPPSFACYQRLQVIVEKIMTGCPPCLSGSRSTNSFSAAETIKEAAGLPFTGCLKCLS